MANQHVDVTVQERKVGVSTAKFVPMRSDLLISLDFNFLLVPPCLLATTFLRQVVLRTLSMFHGSPLSAGQVSKYSQTVY